MKLYKFATNSKTGFDFFLVEGGGVVKKCQTTKVIYGYHIVDVLTDRRCEVLLSAKRIKQIMGR